MIECDVRGFDSSELKTPGSFQQNRLLFRVCPELIQTFLGN